MSADKPTSTPSPATPAASESGATRILSVGDDPGRGEVSAATIGRMMGLASVRELNLLDSKLELMMSKVNNLTARLERILSILGSAPTGKDLERIDVQIAALRTELKVAMGGEAAGDSDANTNSGSSKRPKIVSSEGEGADSEPAK